MDAVDQHGATETGVATEHSNSDARIDITKGLAQLTTVRQCLCRLLGEEGLSIQQATSASVLLELINGNRFDHLYKK